MFNMDQSMFFTLLVFLLLASWFDFKHFRIPNFLTFTAALTGLVLSAISGNGLMLSFAGGVIGLALFVVPYASGKMGAGDVKMLAAAGTFLGPIAVIWAALWSLIVGGVFAVLWVLYIKIRPEHAYVPSETNRNEGLENPQRSTTMPYALAISIGVMIALFSGN